MGWRQYDKVSDDLKNIAFKATLAPVFRKINSSRLLNKKSLLPKRIVICGCPRSGTTLMNELMRCFKDVYVMHREEYSLRFPYLFIKEKYIVTKHPLDFRHFDRIIDIFSDPSIIFLLRDPRDVVISKHYKNKNAYLITFPTWEDAIRSYENLGYDRKLLIRYEKLITEPESVQNQIAQKFHLDIDTDFKEFYKHVSKGHQDIKSLGGARPIDSCNTGKYMQPQHFGRIMEQLQQFPSISDYLIKYGFEKDKSWEQHFLKN